MGLHQGTHLQHKKQNIIVHLHSQSFVEIFYQLPHPVPSTPCPVNAQSLTRTKYFDPNHWPMKGKFFLLCGNFRVRNSCNLPPLAFKNRNYAEMHPARGRFKFKRWLLANRTFLRMHLSSNNLAGHVSLLVCPSTRQMSCWWGKTINDTSCSYGPFK